MDTSRMLGQRGRGGLLFRFGAGLVISIILGQLPIFAQNPKTVLSNPTRRAQEMALVVEIHKKIVANHIETTEAEMKRYQVDLPPLNTRISSGTFTMLPIKGGTFTMGNPDSKTDPHETPAHNVTVNPFWMQQCEVTWNEYEPYMLQMHRSNPDWKSNSVVDAVAYPSRPYLEMSFGMGKDGYPAVSMTQHAANKYCQWLSARTGQFYRLPTEAEWEYACRAGAETAYSFGDDPAQLGKYAWFEENTDRYRKGGQKLPNAWGLHDMHGNVAEWTLDGFALYNKSPARNPWIKGTNTYPHVVRGGSWADPDTACPSASRKPSSGYWNADPTLPKSSWYLTHSTVGFRIVRPLKVPTAEEMFAYWNNEVEIDFSPMPPRDYPMPTQ
ncbi:MAG: formylglycine-generating enzyme family protein [Limisphaerales bacterium]